MAFGALGFGGAGWTARIPELRQTLHLSLSTVGLLVAATALGGAVAMPVAGFIVRRLGSARTVAVVAAVFGAALVTMAVGVLGYRALLVAGLVSMGAATAVWDVAIAVQAAVIERRLKHAVLPVCFGAFSGGAILGALTATTLIAVGVQAAVQLAATGLVIALGAGKVAAQLLADEPRPRRVPRRERREPRAHPEARTLALGVLALAFAVAEGAGGGWIGVEVVSRFHVTSSGAAGAYGLFLAAVTASRLSASRVTRHLRPEVLLRTAIALGALGVLVFVTASWPVLSCLGVALWGAGVALGLPATLSAGSGDAAGHAAGDAGRITAIAGIAYVGFLTGPAAISALAAVTSLPLALAAVAALLIAVTPFTALAKSPRLTNPLATTTHLRKAQS